MRKAVALLLAGVTGPLAVLLLVAATVTGTIEDRAAAAPSTAATADIPADLLPLYRKAAATCPGLPWSVLAAIGKIETDHGRSQAPGVTAGENYAGAGGPMQFLPSTWAVYGVDANGDGRTDRYDPADAIFGAAHYLCESGAGQTRHLYRAVFAYNHADSYVRAVLTQATAYEAARIPTDAATLLGDARLTLSPNARTDMASGTVDPRLIAALGNMLTRHTLTIVVFKTGHPKMIVTDSGPGTVISTHYYGRGMDITAVDGRPVGRTNLRARKAVLELRRLLTGTRYELGQPWPELVQPGTFSNQVHQDHIHVGVFT
jgi:hypothetical protein